jgi:mannose-6-phosphate isomerase-like protein (cupin superfamily)
VPEPIVVEPGEGEVIPPFGPVIKAPSELSGGAFTVIESLLMPGESGPPMHLHRSHDESFYVLEGIATLVTPGGEHDVEPGGYVFVPRGTAHTITNRSEEDAVRYLAVTSGGLDRFIAELHEADDDAATRAVFERYDTEPVS